MGERRFPGQAISPLERLQQEPARFELDQAAAVIASHRDPTEISYRSQTRLGAPGGEIEQARADLTELTVPTFGLIGPGGVLPRHYTALVDKESRRRSKALHAFIDMLTRRFIGFFVKAGAKYRPTRDPRVAEGVLSAAVGLATPHLASELNAPLEAILYHAGHLAARSRSAERLRGILSEETDSEVLIEEFAGGWVRLPVLEQSRLASHGRPGRYSQLGENAAIGSQMWDTSARFLIHLGPLSLQSFRMLLPGAPLHIRLAELTRFHVGLEQDFAFNPILKAAEVPSLRLGAPGAGGAQLGWSSWLMTPRSRETDAAEAILRPVSSRKESAPV